MDPLQELKMLTVGDPIPGGDIGVFLGNCILALEERIHALELGLPSDEDEH